jgi:hypothetical protein
MFKNVKSVGFLSARNLVGNKPLARRALTNVSSLMIEKSNQQNKFGLIQTRNLMSKAVVVKQSRIVYRQSTMYVSFQLNLQQSVKKMVRFVKKLKILVN